MNKLALVSSDLNKNYLSFFPIVHLLWNKVINIPVKLILINDKIPDYLLKYKDDIILFKPIENMNTAFQAQCIRLLYPCLLNDNIVVISDIDILPISKKYFNIDVKNNFVVMRDAYQKQQMFGMCHNMAKSEIWTKVFNINSEEDIRIRLNEWYDNDYKINKSNKHWYTDQKQLFKYVKNTNENVIILSDKKTGYKSFDLKRVDNLVYFLEKETEFYSKLKNYTNIHCNKPYIYIIKKILDNILSCNFNDELNLLDKSFGNQSLNTYKKMKYKIMTYSWSSYIQRIETGLMKYQLNNYFTNKEYQVIILCKSFYYYKATLLNLLYNKIIGLNNLLIYTSERSDPKIQIINKNLLKNYKIIKLKTFDNIFEQITTNYKKILIIKPGFLILEPTKFILELENEVYGEECYILNKPTNKGIYKNNLCCHTTYIDNPLSIYNLDVNKINIVHFYKLIRSIKKYHNTIRRLI